MNGETNWRRNAEKSFRDKDIPNNWRIPKINTMKPGHLKNHENYKVDYKKNEINKNSEKEKTDRTNCEIKCNQINKENLSQKEKINGKDQDNTINSSTNQINKLTSKELSILNEEPLNTTNPLKAIFGYIPKDDKRICKFTVNGECFKNNCPLSHETKISEGWTKDQSSVIISNCNEVIHPDINTFFQFIPTHIEECGYKFYGQIISSDLKIFYDLMNEINKIEEIESYENYSENLIPTLTELVLAKYFDGLFYRGQIIDYNENNNTVLVFFVDYGNMEIVKLKDIKKWKRNFEIVPFQAIHFTLDGIKHKVDKRNEFKYFMEEILLNKILNGITTDYLDSTYIKILDDYEIDITDKLLKFDVCEINSFKFSFKKYSGRIPG